MAVAVSSFDTGHGDLIHDTQFDYYGRRLATCSSDGLVRVFSVEQEPAQYLADLVGHQGPVWQIAWAHPKFGNVLASASFDHTVIVWRETQDGSWVILHRTDAYLHTGSINSISWAPHDLGFVLAAASSDGNLSVHACNLQKGEWSVSMVHNESNAPAHPMGAMAVSFAPALEAGALVGRGKNKGPVWRLASGGCDTAVRIWTLSQDNVWRMEGPPLAHHTGWVRDVAWAPNLGLPRNIIASAGQDGKVLIWTEEASNPGAWKHTLVKDYTKSRPVWSVSWSTIGNVLAVSAAGPNDTDDAVELFKEGIDGAWEPVPLDDAANDAVGEH